MSLDESSESLSASIGNPGSYSIADEYLGSESSFGDKDCKLDMKRSTKTFWSRRNKVASDVAVDDQIDVAVDDQIVSQWKCSSRHSCRRFALLDGEIIDDVCDLKKVLIKRCMEECGM